MDSRAGEESKAVYTAGLYRGKPYVSGEQPASGSLKLNTNENPYPPAPGVLRALSGFDGERLRLYPKQDGGALREAIASRHGVGTENVFVGNGSDEVLAFAFRACFGFGRERPVLFPDVTYSFYPVWCDFFGIPYEAVPVREDFRPAAADYARPSGGVVVCDPNAPTGVAEGEEFLDMILEGNGGGSVVIVDEAYADFAGAESSAIPRTAGTSNLLVTRSFSKGRSLAGLRLGYAVGDARLIDALAATKDSFNSYPISAPAETLGMAALADEEYYRAVVDSIVRTRDETAIRLRALGFGVPDSAANFVFAGCGSARRARAIYEFLREGGVFVRYFDMPRIDDHLRISIGTPEDMDALFSRLEEACSLKI